MNATQQSRSAPQHDGAAPPSRGAHREVFLDTVRSIAVVRVILWHAFGNPVLSYLVASMPAMFFVAGSLLAASFERRDARSVIVDRCRRLLVPFWLFGAFAFAVMGVARVTVANAGTAVHLRDVIGWLVPVIDPHGSVWEGGWLAQPLWYMRAFLWLLVAAPLLLRALRRWPIAVFAPSLIAVFVIDWWVRHPSAAPFGFATWRWYVGDFALYSIFVLLGFRHRQGAFVSMTTRARAEWAAIGAAAAVLWCTTQPVIGHVVNNSYPAHLLVGFTWLFTFLALEPWLARSRDVRAFDAVIGWLTRRSMTVYLWHTTAIASAYYLIGRFAPSAPRIAILPIVIVMLPMLVALTGWVEDLAARRAPQLWPGYRLRWPVARRSSVVWGRVPALATDRRALAGFGAGLALAMMAVTTMPVPRQVTGASATSSTTGVSAAAKKPPAPSARPDTAVFESSTGATTTTKATTKSTTTNAASGSKTAAATNAAATVPAALDQQLRDAVGAWRTELNVDGVVISIGLPNGQRWSNESGSLKLSDPFAVTSLTKTFTASLVLRLVDEGKIKLDDPLPEIASVAGFAYRQQITPRMLLNHTSGLSTYQDSKAYLADPGMQVDPAKAVQLAASEPLLWAPGTNSGYSSSGYLLAGLLAEQAGGATYEKQLQDEFFTPLHLNDTILDNTPVDGWIGWSTGGVVTTMDDLVTWGAALYRDRTVLSPELSDAMVNIDNAWSVGLGAWPVCPCTQDPDGTKHVTSIGHNGGSATLQYSPSDGLVIAAGLSEPIFNNRITQQDLYALLATLRQIIAAA